MNCLIQSYIDHISRCYKKTLAISIKTLNWNKFDIQNTLTKVLKDHDVTTYININTETTQASMWSNWNSHTLPVKM